MKKRKLGLFPKVLIAITIGSLLGTYSAGCYDQNI